MKVTPATASLLAMALWASACGPPPKASPSPTPATPTPPPTPTPAPTPPPPSYTDVLKTFPPETKMCRTVVYLSDVQFGDLLVLSVDAKGTDPFQRAPKDPTIRCVGTQVVVMKNLQLEGKRYKRGALLTVDKANKWIEVSSGQ